MSKKEILIKENEEEIPYDKLRHAICDWIEMEGLRIPVITGALKLSDHLGTLAVRTGFMRKHYKVPSGLYALGNPDERTDIFVTANYKYSFDLLRQGLEGLNAWILVLDTQGINVWCAAGKGTFSSRELIYQLHKWKLKKQVKHRRVLLPQLGATQMEPHLVRRYSGFNVQYGPVRAEDLKTYLNQDKEATEAMRTVTFSLKDRLYLAPVEVLHGLKYLALLLLIMKLVEWMSGTTMGYSTWRWEDIPLGIAFLTGTVVYPMLLPILPFQRFSLKGAVLGGIEVLLYMIFVFYHKVAIPMTALGGISIAMIVILSALGLVFTGSTTFTSFAGVDRETRQAAPWYGIGGVLAVVLWMMSRLI